MAQEALLGLTVKDFTGANRQTLIPKAFVSGTGVVPRSRLRVEQSHTAFEEGREFRSYLEFSIASAATQVVRVTSPVDFVLYFQSLMIDNGSVRFAPTTLGTPSGVWTTVPVIGKNRMAERPAPLYVPQITLDTGGAHTGGTEVEVIHLASGAQGSHTDSVGGSVADERGLPAGTYYLKIANTSGVTVTGVYSLYWEERVAQSSIIF